MVDGVVGMRDGGGRQGADGALRQRGDGGRPGYVPNTQACRADASSLATLASHRSTWMNRALW